MAGVWGQLKLLSAARRPKASQKLEIREFRKVQGVAHAATC
jgi:hypothetical protein